MIYRADNFYMASVKIQPSDMNKTIAGIDKINGRRFSLKIYSTMNFLMIILQRGTDRSKRNIRHSNSFQALQFLSVVWDYMDLWHLQPRNAPKK